MQRIIAPFIKLINEIRSEYASAPEKDHGLENHIFRISTVVISTLLFLILIPYNLLQDFPYLVSVPAVLCGGVSFTLYLAARRGNNHVNAMLIVILVAFNVSWFLNRGSEGNMPYFFFPLCVFPLFYYHGWKLGIILAGIIANGCVLLALSHRYPWTVTPYAIGFDRTMDLMVGMISSSACITLVVWLVLDTYRREQERLKALNLKLEREIEARMLSEEALKRSEERFRTIFNNSADPIFIRDQGYSIIEVNDVACQRLGYGREDFLRMDYLDIVCKKDPGRLLDLQEKIYSAGQVTYESSLATADGKEIPVEVSARYINFEGRNLVLSISRDITERKRAERRLAELNDCFLRFGADSDRNIDRLVALYGEQVGAACAVYSRLEGEDLLPVSTWNTPADFSKAPHCPGQICYEVFHGFKNQVIVIENLPQSEYMKTDPKLSRYGIRTYIGKTVSYDGTERGLLCAVYVDDITPGEEDKKLLGIVASAIGVEEERKKALAAMKENEATLRSITGSARDAIIMIDGEGRTSFWNESATQIFGWNEAQALGNNLNALIMPDRYHDAFCEGIRRFAATGTGNAIGRTLELQAMRMDGSEVPVEVSLSAVQIKGQWNAVGIIRDMTERKRAEAEIEHLAYHDALTGLPNRLLLDDRLSQAIAHAGRLGNMIGVLCFDLDNFKSVNDSLGHPVGDLLLKEVAERLGRRLRKSDSIARMGGDEFIVVLTDITVPEDAAHAAGLFLESFSEPFHLNGQEIYTSTSVGISLYPVDGASTAALLKNADIAMYQAKKVGRNSFQFYTEEINRRAEERLLLENELRHAINRDEFVLYYQPWIDLATGSIGGMEALIRWVHPEHGIILPARFIPIAEETGLIIPIGEWVMRTACRFLEEMHRNGLGRITTSVNVSGVQLRNPNLIGLLGLLLADAPFDSSRLELELTESAVMENLEESRRYMDALKMFGVRLALDDFGTGYSSLSYLKRFPLDRLKIDRSFVRDCPDNPDDVAIARAVIALARSLNLQVTAEGVENLEQADFFSRENCDVIQGNLLCSPLPGDELLRLLCPEENRGVRAECICSSSLPS